jgi:hypothetical protein
LNIRKRKEEEEEEERKRRKKRKAQKKKKKNLGPIFQFSCLRQMFKGLNPFKPFGGSFLFGPLLA